MKPWILLISFIVLTGSSAKTVEKRPFSVNALQYLLKRKEYDRFDFYITSYLRQHPDTAVLYLLKGYRYFEEARCLKSQRYYRNTSRTGGIPRKYPECLLTPQSRESARLKVFYNTDLIQKAFAEMRRARSIEPDRLDIYTGICHMAIEADLPDILAYEIQTLFRRFGKNDDLVKLVLEYSRKQDVTADNSGMIQLLHTVCTWYPENGEILAELGKYYYHAGKFDSAYCYIMDALERDPDNTEVIGHIIRLASIRGNFSVACSLSLQSYTISQDLLYLEQAAIFALTFDSIYAAELRAQIESLPDYVDSTSITKDLFEEYYHNTSKKVERKFFVGDLFHLNFPLFYTHYKRDNNKIAYYEYKAGAFYAYGIYDSAAYYNLNLLRVIKAEDKRGIPVLFNLAAEYYAEGKYRLSYFRFLDLYRFYNGSRDAAVRYGLGLNFEKFGDLANAQQHYLYVVKHPNEFYNNYYYLQDLAAYRLGRIRGNRLVSYR